MPVYGFLAAVQSSLSRYTTQIGKIFWVFDIFYWQNPEVFMIIIVKLNLLFRRRIYLRGKETYDSFNAYAK